MRNLTSCIPDVIVLVCGFFILYLTRWKKLPARTRKLYSLFYLYLSLVFYETWMPFFISIPDMFHHVYQAMNMSPFIDIVEGHNNAQTEILLNILLFVPFGFLYPQVTKKRMSAVIAAAFLFSLIIELVQPLLSTYRVADISDLITNTIGGIFGYLIYAFLKRHDILQ